MLTGPTTARRERNRSLQVRRDSGFRHARNYPKRALDLACGRSSVHSRGASRTARQTQGQSPQRFRRVSRERDLERVNDERLLVIQEHELMRVPTADYSALQLEALHVPQPLTVVDGRQLVLFNGEFFWTDAGVAVTSEMAQDAFERMLQAEDDELIRAAEKIQAGWRRAAKLDWASRVSAGDEQPTREAIPLDVRYAVWERDGHACTGCQSTFDLQYDHVIPLAIGGSSSAKNLQLLCGDRNRRKGATLG